MRFAPDRLADTLQRTSPRQSATGIKWTSWTLQDRSRVSAFRAPCPVRDVPALVTRCDDGPWVGSTAAAGTKSHARAAVAGRREGIFRARVARAADRSWRRCLRPSRSSRDVPPESGYVAAAASPARWAPVPGAAAEPALRLLADRAGQPSGPRPPDVAGANTAGRASGFVPVLDRPFQVAVAFPRAGDLPGDTGVFDDLHQPGTLTPEVLGNPCG